MFAKSLFATHAAIRTLYPPMTIAAATHAARILGITIRRAGQGFDVYPKGHGDMAMFAECPAESLFIAEAMAADMDNARVALMSGRPTNKSVIEVLASRVSEAYGVEIAGDYVRRDVVGDYVAVFGGPLDRSGKFNHVIDPALPVAELAAAIACAADAAGLDEKTRQERAAAPETGPRSLSAAANPDAPKPRRRIRTRDQMETDAAAPGIAGELARMGLAAVSVSGSGQSGSFPMWATDPRDHMRLHDGDSAWADLF